MLVLAISLTLIFLDDFFYTTETDPYAICIKIRFFWSASNRQLKKCGYPIRFIHTAALLFFKVT